MFGQYIWEGKKTESESTRSDSEGGSRDRAYLTSEEVWPECGQKKEREERVIAPYGFPIYFNAL